MIHFDSAHKRENWKQAGILLMAGLNKTWIESDWEMGSKTWQPYNNDFFLSSETRIHAGPVIPVAQPMDSVRWEHTSWFQSLRSEI